MGLLKRGVAGGMLWAWLVLPGTPQAHGAQPSPALPMPNVGVSPGTVSGTPLTLEEAVRIGLENHSSIKSAGFQTLAQAAIVKQRMSAYYPTVSLDNSFGNRGGKASKTSDSLSSRIGFDMTLYNFGKREGTVQAARETLDARQFSYQATTNDIALFVKQAYYRVLQRNALLNVNDDTVKNRAATLKQTQSFYDVGTRPRSDVTQAQANLYTAQARLIQARKDVDVAWAELRNALGVDEFAKQPLGEELSLSPFPMTLEQAKEEAFANRPELLQFNADLRARDQLIAVARRNHLPDFTFNSSYGWNGSNGSGNELFPLQSNWVVGLNFNIPLFNGFQTTYKLQEELASYGSTKEQLRVQRQQVALEVESNYLNLVALRDVVNANEAAAVAAKQNLELQEARYQVGYATIVDVTTAQVTLTTAQIDYVNSIIDYKLAVAQVTNAIGRQ